MRAQELLLSAGLLALSANLQAQFLPLQSGIYRVAVQYANGAGAVGSAVQVSPGKLVTSCHTVRSATAIRIAHREGEVSTHLVRGDYLHDVCLLSAPELKGPTPARVPSLELAVGEPVTAAGFGMGFRMSISDGAVTALYRLDDGYVVRTSAWFPKGASGGGLFDEDGRLVGILTFRATLSSELSYAVPVEWVERLLRDEGDERAPNPTTLAFWEDDAPNPPRFLRAAWLEYDSSWQQLLGLALAWVQDEQDNAEAWLALGRAHAGLKQFPAAIFDFRRAASLQLNNASAWQGLALAYYSTGLGDNFERATARLAVLDGRMAARLRANLVRPE